VGSKRPGRLASIWELLKRDPVALAAVGYLALLIVGALIAPYIVGADATTMNLSARNTAPAIDGEFGTHIFGTDPLGRDLFDRILLAARVSLSIAFLVVGLSMLIGATVGVLSGFFGGFWDDVMMRITDVFMGFPSLLLVMVIIYALGAGIMNLVIVLVATRWMLYARVARAETLKLAQLEFVTAAHAMGATRSRVVRRHLAPNLVPSMATLGILEISTVILTEAGLSFLGLGVSGNSWGRLIADGQEYITSAWWLVTFPGLVILITTVSLAVLANWLVVYLDPSQRARAFARIGVQRHVQ
jgi:peptide/nickel transport system permease protein